MKLKLVLVAFFTLSLTSLSVIVVDLPWVFDEEDFITVPTQIKQWINKDVKKNHFYDTSYIQKNFLILNTTHDQELTSDDKNILRQEDPGIPITSRKKLAELLRMLNTNDSLYNYIICDVVFEFPSFSKAWDDSLKKYMNELQIKEKILFGVPYSKNTKTFELNQYNNIDLKNMGATNKESASGYYIKHRLTFDDARVRSLPLLLFERTHNISVENTNWPGCIKYRQGKNKAVVYNSFIPEMLFTRQDFDNFYTNHLGTYDSNTVICDLGVVVSDSTGLYLHTLLNTRSINKKIFL